MVLTVGHEIMLPENSPVRLISAQLEELDYRKAILRVFAQRAEIDHQTVKVMAYSYFRGMYASRKMEDACRYRIDFMWPLDGEPAPDYSTFAGFRTGRCGEAAEDLFCRLVKKLEEQGRLTMKRENGRLQTHLSELMIA